MDINFITTQKETILPLNAYGAHLWLEIVYSSTTNNFPCKNKSKFMF